MGISEDARAMKSYIEEHGWIQGSLSSPEGVCVYGACCRVVHHEQVGDLYKEDGVLAAIASYANGQRDGRCVIAVWNDQPGRTKEEVLDMLENVAIKYDTDEFRSKGINADG